MRMLTVAVVLVIAVANSISVATPNKTPELSHRKDISEIVDLSKRSTDGVCQAFWIVVCRWQYSWRYGWYRTCWWQAQCTRRRRRSAGISEVPVALDYNSWIGKCRNRVLDFPCFARNNNVRMDKRSRDAFNAADIRERNGILSRQEFYEAPWLFEGQEDGAPAALKAAARILIKKKARRVPHTGLRIAPKRATMENDNIEQFRDLLEKAST